MKQEKKTSNKTQEKEACMKRDENKLQQNELHGARRSQTKQNRENECMEKEDNKQQNMAGQRRKHQRHHSTPKRSLNSMYVGCGEASYCIGVSAVRTVCMFYRV
jgi:hypothetical protein